MSMSHLFSDILISSSVFANYFIETNNDVFLLLEKLPRVIATVYNGTWHKRGKGQLISWQSHGLFKKRAEEFLIAANYTWKISCEFWSELDKPNAREILELCITTISMFAHQKNCSERLLKMQHQVVKGWMEDNMNADFHISAVERALMRD